MKNVRMKMGCFIGTLLMMLDCFASDARQDFQNTMQSIKTLQASFTQTMTMDNRALATQKGTMALSRPNQFRWDTKTPVAQLLILDGEHLWIYDKDLEQVTVKKQKKVMGSAAGLFLSQDDATVLLEYQVSMTRKAEILEYDLKAKHSQQDFKRVILSFKGNKLTQMQLFDQLGQHTTITFSKIVVNQSLSKQLFEFKPPKGVDVIDEGETRA